MRRCQFSNGGIRVVFQLEGQKTVSLENSRGKQCRIFTYGGISFGKNTAVSYWKHWSAREDLNLRPPGPEPHSKPCWILTEFVIRKWLILNPLHALNLNTAELCGFWTLWQPHFCLQLNGVRGWRLIAESSTTKYSAAVRTASSGKHQPIVPHPRRTTTSCGLTHWQSF